MRMSYRRAWGLVRSINEVAGETLIEVTTGGQTGGGATLTQKGRDALALYRKLVQRLARTAAQFVGNDALV
jgi:molybdate transport system regulatory protein